MQPISSSFSGCHLLSDEPARPGHEDDFQLRITVTVSEASGSCAPKVSFCSRFVCCQSGVSFPLKGNAWTVPQDDTWVLDNVTN